MFLSKSVLDHVKFCAELSRAVYAPELLLNPENIESVVGELDVERDFKYFSIEACDTQAFVLIKGDFVYVSFQGTQSLFDWLKNFCMELKGINDIGHHHTGFMSVTEESFPIVGEHLLSVLKNYPNKKIVLTGHSLGGAMATLYAFILKQKHPNVNIHSLITFGQPRCGDKPFSEHLNSLKLDYKRFVNTGDYIADVPPPSAIGKWSHAGLGFVLSDMEMFLESINYESQNSFRILSALRATYQLLKANNYKIKGLKKEDLKKISSNHEMSLYIKRIEDEIARK